MKLLLTSSGLDNGTIADALISLTGKNPNETKVGFVPTAINAESGNKDWAINQFTKFWRRGYNWVDIIDPSAAGIDWKKKLCECDVVYLSGGNTFHLLDQTRKTGFDKWLEKNKETKVFIGSSAGTILFTPNIDVAAEDYGDENLAGVNDLTGMNWVDFEVAPHYEQRLDGALQKYAESRDIIYAIDDQTAIKVEDDKAEVVSEGFWKAFNT